MAPRRLEADNDLLEGLHEWKPVQEIVRLTFKALHDVVKAQGDAIKNLERAMAQKVSKPEFAASLAEKVNMTELSQTFDDLSRIIDGKADEKQMHKSLQEQRSSFLQRCCSCAHRPLRRLL